MTADFTDGISMMTRVKTTSNSKLEPRLKRKVTFEPAAPRIWEEASSTVISAVLRPSISRMRSPGWIPSFHAGVSSMGDTTST